MTISNVTRVAVRRNANYQANGTKSLVWLFHKYGINPTKPGRYHRGEQNKLMKRQDDGTAVPITADDQQNNSFYTCPIQIGTPAQTFNMDFDSGSADLWVWSTGLSQSVQKQKTSSGGAVFDSSKSSTFKNMSGSTWQIQYGDGSSASGTVGTDTVTLGNIVIQNQAVELADTISSQLQGEAGSDGLLGLAFGTINTVKPKPVQTPLENMITEKDIPTDEELFTCCLGTSATSTSSDDASSYYTFGGLDQQEIQAAGQDIAYTPVDNSQGFWMFDSPSVTINGTQTTLSGNTAIADTGTTLLLVSDAVVEDIYKAIPGSTYSQADQGYVFPENTSADSLPTIEFAVGNTSITINKDYLAFASSSQSGMVFGGIQSQGNNGFNIFGDVFLRCCYAIFDSGNTRFGVVQRTDDSTASS